MVLVVLTNTRDDMRDLRVNPPKYFATIIPRVFPAFILAFAGYFSYAYCYRYSWLHVGGARGIVMISIYSVLAALILFTWGLLLVKGPGIINHVDVGSELPEIFMCDPQGYRQWCSNCSSIKPDRAHHAKQVGRCVPKMDHYCAWLNAVIGQGNFKLFLQFVFYFWLELVYILITLLIYSHGPGLSSQVGNHEIALYCIAGFWVLLLTGFFIVQLKYVFGNVTTIEHMDIGRRNYPIYNMECDGKRVVTRLYREDLFPKGPYNAGSYANFKEAMGPGLLHWLLPVPVKYMPSVFNPELLETLRMRYRSGAEGYLSLAGGILEKTGPEITGNS